MSTATEQDNKTVHDQADKSKANLTEGVSAHVPGQEAVPPGTKRDPFGDRKALFAMADAKRDAEAQKVQDDNPSVRERVQAMEAEARGGAAPAPAPAPAGAPAPSQSENGYATLTYNGRQVSVARMDIEAAGGEQAYLRQLRDDERDAALAEQAAEMQRRQAEINAQAEDLKRRQEEFQRSLTVAREAPATGGVGTTPQGGNPPAAGADNLEAEANKLVEMLFNGDPAEASKAVRQILTEARQSRTAMPNAEQVAELAAQKLRATTQAPAPRTEATPAPAKVDPKWERTRQAINSMAESEFPTIAKNPQYAEMTRKEITRLYSLPQNKDRRAVDVAREACQLVQSELNRQQRIEVKQGLPSAPSAGGTAPAPAGEGDNIPTGSSFVDMLKDRRNFGPRNRQ